MYSDDLGVVIIMRKRCSIQQGEKKITVDQSKVLKNRLYRLFRSIWATRYRTTGLQVLPNNALGEIPINVKLENLSTIRRHSITSHYIIPRIDNLLDDGSRYLPITTNSTLHTLWRHRTAIFHIIS